ncbi:unnamed protein product, partial [Urochloa humidicola]
PLPYVATSSFTSAASPPLLRPPVLLLLRPSAVPRLFSTSAAFPASNMHAIQLLRSICLAVERGMSVGEGTLHGEADSGSSSTPW